MNPIKMQLLLVSFAIFSFANAQNEPVFISDSIEVYIEKALSQWNIPAIAVGIVKDGQVVYEKGFGLASYGGVEPVNEHTLFMIGSNTKAFTGTAMAKLDDEGVLNLDDRVQQWIPEFSMQDSLASNYMNLTDILSHRTGMETFQGDFMYFDTDFTPMEAIAKFGKLEPTYDFRTQWGYCNLGYIITGEVMKRATSITWNEIFLNDFFQPLQMNHTVTTVAAMKAASNASKPHSYVDGELVEIPHGGLDLTGPAATISSSVADMNHWLLMLTDSGRFEGETIVSQKVIDRTRKPESIIGKPYHAFNKGHYKLYGLGWELSDYESHGVVCHTGGVHGYLSSVTLVPDENLGIVILTNTDQNAFYEALKWEILDAYLGLPYRNYSAVYRGYFERNKIRDQKALDAMRAKVTIANEPPVPLKQFAGVYESAVYGKATIKVTKKHLEMSLAHHPDLMVKMDYMEDSSFLCTYSNPMLGIKPFPFLIEAGRVKSFTLSAASYLEFTTYEFVKLKE